MTLVQVPVQTATNLPDIFGSLHPESAQDERPGPFDKKGLSSKLACSGTVNCSYTRSVQKWGPLS